MKIDKIMKLENVNKVYKASEEMWLLIEKEIITGRKIVQLVDKNGKAIETAKFLCDVLHWDFEEVVDWTKVPVDTPLLVKNNSENWKRRHFAYYKDNEVYCWAEGQTSFTTKNVKAFCTRWETAKLYEGNEDEHE